MAARSARAPVVTVVARKELLEALSALCAGSPMSNRVRGAADGAGVPRATVAAVPVAVAAVPAKAVVHRNTGIPSPACSQEKTPYPGWVPDSVAVSAGIAAIPVVPA